MRDEVWTNLDDRARAISNSQGCGIGDDISPRTLRDGCGRRTVSCDRCGSDSCILGAICRPELVISTESASEGTTSKRQGSEGGLHLQDREQKYMGIVVERPIFF